jgi:N-methylhydantoinase B/oxoprolinase/acetone carboxylase alpha subunit
MMASSQSTMNNLTVGDDNYQYYGTIAGGVPQPRPSTAQLWFKLQ